MCNRFDTIEPITLEMFEREWPQLQRDLAMAGLTDPEPIGTTGKKQLMGDIDVACKFKGTPEEAYEAIAQHFGKHNTRRVGGNIVSVCYGAEDPGYQVDIMLGDPTYLRWARAGTSEDPKHPDYSHVKNVARNVLLNVITRFASEEKWPSVSPLERYRWCIDFDMGLFEVKQTKRGKNGRVLKDWKTNCRFRVSSDPDTIVHKVFGKKASAQDTRTFEGVVVALFRSRWKKLGPQIMLTFASEMRELVTKTPRLLGDEPEKALEYIDALAGG